MSLTSFLCSGRLGKFMQLFVKLFSSILDSSIWSESQPTRLTWITLLAMADENGYVHAALPGLARRANISETEVVAALAVLLGPDPQSMNSANDGRRIQRISGGWLLLNYKSYRQVQTHRQQLDAARQRRHYDRQREGREGPREVREVREARKTSRPSRQNKNKNKSKSKKNSAQSRARFGLFWAIWPHKVSKLDAERAWVKLDPSDARTDELIVVVGQQVEDRAIAARHGRWYPEWSYPASWIRQERFNDELVYLGTSQDPDVVRPAEVINAMIKALTVVDAKAAWCVRGPATVVELGPDSVTVRTRFLDKLAEYDQLLETAVHELVGPCTFTMVEQAS